MPTVPIDIAAHLRLNSNSIRPGPSATLENPLPTLLQTPTGLALLEIQGTINLPPSPNDAANNIGRLEFPLYDPDDITESKAWMKMVYL